MSKFEPTISDHAMLRILERVAGIDIDALRKQILTPERKAAIRAGAVSIQFDGYTLPVRNGVVTTVLPKGARIPHWHRGDGRPVCLPPGI